MKKYLLSVLILAALISLQACRSAPVMRAGDPSLALDTVKKTATVMPSETSTPAATPTATPTAKVARTFRSPAPPLSEKDFQIIYKGTVVKIGMTTKELKETIGIDSATAANNYGFIDYSKDRKYKLYWYRYEGFDVNTRHEIITGLPGVVYVIKYISGQTDRGIKAGDTYDDMIAAYGAPSETGQNQDKTSYKYKLDDRQLIFDINDSKQIVWITIL